jgi:ferredoxin
MTMTYAGLPEHSSDGRARARALATAGLGEVTPTSVVEFVSKGRCLVLGDEPVALAFARQLPASLDVIVAAPGDGDPELRQVDGQRLVRGGRALISGALGNFTVTLVSGNERLDVGSLISQPAERIDLVVDLGKKPLLQQGLPPLGYYWPGPDPAGWDEVLATLPEMRGEFEKPKFYNYDPEICAHGRSGKTGCTRCIEACPAEAIVSLGEKVEVNPYLCQGGGACATACPTGAISYAYPLARDLLTGIRRMLESYRDCGGRDPCLLFHDETGLAALSASLGAEMPERILPIAVEDIGSVGMDTWLACLAYGADAVVLLTTDRTPPQVVETAQGQLITTRALLGGMGYGEHCVQLQNADQPAAVMDSLRRLPTGVLKRPAKFSTAANDKRGTLRLALEELGSQAPAPRRSISLPAGSPFGEIRVDAAACTLCMSCASVCPTHAVQDGRGLPQLNFREWNCVQCGLCEKACPESAITLNARFLYDRDAREKTRVLHEEQPFCCVSCGRPFATRSMLEKLEQKLEGHWMFQSEEARRRMRMCEDCKVRDMFSSQAGQH